MSLEIRYRRGPVIAQVIFFGAFTIGCAIAVALDLRGNMGISRIMPEVLTAGGLAGLVYLIDRIRRWRLNDGPALTITGDGIIFYHPPLGTVPWDDIARIGTKGAEGQKVLQIWFSLPPKFDLLARISARLDRGFGKKAPQLVFVTKFLDKPLTEILAAVPEHISGDQ